MERITDTLFDHRLWKVSKNKGRRTHSKFPDHAESRRRTYTGQRFHAMLLGMIRARQGTSVRNHWRGTAAILLRWARAFPAPSPSWPDRRQDRYGSFQCFRGQARAQWWRCPLPPGADAWRWCGE